MSDFNNPGEVHNSALSGQVKWLKRPKRPGALVPGSPHESSNSRCTGFLPLNNSENEEIELLSILHQELKDIQEGMIRTNAALFELIAEMKLRVQII